MIDGSRLTVLDTEGVLADGGDWSGKLYRELAPKNEKVKLTLVPYYAWGNRGHSEMSVWLPLAR